MQYKAFDMIVPACGVSGLPAAVSRLRADIFN